MSQIELHAGQVYVLISLWEKDGQSQAELVRNLLVSPPTIYNMVVRMADSGLIEIRKCENDARIMRVFLTEKGTSIKPRVEHQWRQMEDFLFSELTETERMMFSLLLKKISKTN